MRAAKPVYMRTLPLAVSVQLLQCQPRPDDTAVGAISAAGG